MTKGKTGWAAVEKAKNENRVPAGKVAPVQTKGKAAPTKAVKKAPKPKKEKVYQAPFGFLVGTTNGEKYTFARQEFTDSEGVIKAVRKAIMVSHEDGLREVVIHLRKQKPSGK